MGWIQNDAMTEPPYLYRVSSITEDCRAAVLQHWDFIVYEVFLT